MNEFLGAVLFVGALLGLFYLVMVAGALSIAHMVILLIILFVVGLIMLFNR